MSYNNRYFARRAAARKPATECGESWDMYRLNLNSCPKCNPNGEHYHNDKGVCEMEPCYRHGGPA